MFNDVSLVSTLLGVSAVSLVCWWMFRRKRYSPPLPPSPGVSLPVIGHLYLVKPDIRQTFRKVKKTCGDVFSLQFGNRLIVVLSSYRSIKEAFKTNGDRFPLRAQLPMLDKVTRNMGMHFFNFIFSFVVSSLAVSIGVIHMWQQYSTFWYPIYFSISVLLCTCSILSKFLKNTIFVLVYVE